MNLSKPALTSVFLIGLMFAASCSAGTEPSVKTSNASGPVVDLTLSDLDGKTVSLANYRGKKLYIKFWASWCPICLAGMSEVEALAANKSDDVEVLTIASPEYLGEMPEGDFRSWAKARKFDVPILIDSGGRFAASLGVDKYPSSMWLSPEGKRIDVHTGQVSNDWIVAHFDEAKGSKARVSTRFPPNPNVGVDYSKAELKEIWLAGGCFWGVEAYFARVYGVADAASGYANGATPNPSYDDVIDGSGHAEVVRVRYDPRRVSLERLLTMFFKIIDPTSLNKQGNDRGVQYRTGIYYKDPSDRSVADAVMKAERSRWNKPVVTELLPLTQFALAENYHQDYLEKNPDGYCHTDFSSLTNATVPPAQVKVDPARYRKPDNATLRKSLTAEQYAVTQEEDTERAYSNEYWDNYVPGLYVDVVTGEPLFTSNEKYDSACGWPSFTRAIVPEVVHYRTDTRYGMTRTEVRSRVGDSHLGHVFDDGPKDRGGKRYCINSASIRFVPVEKLAAEGYAEFRTLFGEK
ncbi:MAG: bifunctional peptide-methionine (S)-S-oxide reductase MsrA/peptide-methionine (R)-S-oxide reductase MsrB [Pseudomonadota bacterium]|nr:bifunctional peptide-methionine (S)-S-oxide reductase MsrA/peptide-methionine (R)-S-oxide reductase MsrB [Pseudomonadota bacterium]